MMIATNQTPASSVVFGDRASFENGLGSLITDTYDQVENGYQNTPYTDEAMSAVVGETTYNTNFYEQTNNVGDIDGDSDREYSSGGRFGSFGLDFTKTSLTEELNGNKLGVFGVAFDIQWSNSKSPATAYVTYGNNTTQNFGLANTLGFWGLTSSDYIQTIHFGGPDGGIRKFTVAIDNLTIGGVSPVPVPAAVWLFGTALIGFVGMSRRRNVA
jgi:hypothetical protein